MSRRLAIVLFSVVMALPMIDGRRALSADRIYMGESTCRQCHHGAGKRNQFNVWRTSKHTNAYAALAMPEAKEIAELSGIDVNPFDSKVCLGCHTTAPETEAWERDSRFYFEDGIQCEACHGPGSGYMELDVMMDREKAMMAGLKMPGEEFCMVCHKEKGSHTAVLRVKEFNYKDALREIAHAGKGGDLPQMEKPAVKLESGPKYTGAMVCGKCHQGSMMGHQYSLWRNSRHARAFAVLGTEKGLKIARDQGIDNPQKASQCLKCHSTGYGNPPGRFLKSFDIAQGVQCESCHGPGSEYSPEAVMTDPIASHEAGLLKVNRETCLKCHKEENFDFPKRVKRIAHPKPKGDRVSQIEYKTPFNLAITKDGQRLFIACEGSDSVIVVNTDIHRVVAEIKIENLPHAVVLSPDETRVYAANRGTDTVSVIDANTYEVLTTIAVGDEPHEMALNNAGDILYVANAASYDVSIVDLKQNREVKRLSAARGTWGIAPSPDGKRLFVSNNLSHYVKFREPSKSEVTVIDADRGVVTDRIMIPSANLVQGVAVAPDDEFALVTLIRTKNLVPMTRVMQGWVITNGIGVLWKDGRVDQLLLDEVNNFFADPTDVVITPDGKYAYVSAGGIDKVAVIDLDKMKALLARSTDKEREAILPNHLTASMEFTLKRIAVGRSPRGMTVSPDGRFVYVADGLDDTISVIDVAKQERTSVIDLGGPKEITLTRKGERIFHSAEVTYGRQFSCHSCHPDGGIDGITYDIEPDGVGLDPVDNRTLRGILDTAPFKWTGKNPSLSRQCGPRLAVFFTRIDPFTPDQVKALDRYICTIPRSPNRYRVGDELTPAQRRGKEMFERTHSNAGREIPIGNRCNTCHPAPYFTNREVADVGTKSWLDQEGILDVPHLNNIYETPPFLHDGRAETLEEIWTRFNPNDEHGLTNDMTKDQLNDLVEYLKTL